MLILTSHAQAEMTVKNSRFLSEVFPVETPEKAREIWHAQKSKYDNGGHIVFAFLTGPQANIMGCSDDGEPSGTAGRPTLEVLKGSGITNILLTTARWFGGTLLGTGGLVHAYTAAAQGVMALCETADFVPLELFRLNVSYMFYDPVKRILEEFSCTVKRETFAEDVAILGSVQEKRIPALRQSLMDLSCGKLVLEVRMDENEPENFIQKNY